MPLISVIVPTYRRPHYLTLALRSVLAQTFGNLEVLVCDNAAQDESARVVEDLADPRITYIPRPHDLGMVANVYDGLHRAQGEYVMKLDDDDVMEPDCLELLVAPFLADRSLAVSASDLSLTDVDGVFLEDLYRVRSRHTGRDRAPEGVIRPFTASVARGTIDMVSSLIRASALDWSTIDERAATSYDLHLLLSAAQDATSAHYSHRRLVQYRQHAGSDTVTRLVQQAEGSLFSREQALESGRHIDVEVLRSTIEITGLHLARALLQEGRTTEARAALRRTKCATPTTETMRLWGLSRLPAPVGRRLAQHRARRAVARTPAALQRAAR